MFGYVRPLKGELKVAEYEWFRSVYCGLCHTLGRRYGLPARFVLNYDLTFFAAVLAATGEDVRFEHRRCIASPLRRKCITCGSASSDLAADVTVLLTYLKLDDEQHDKTGVKRIGAKILKLLFQPFYRRASRFRPELAQKMEALLQQLRQLELDKCPSIDKTADAFASILSEAASEAKLDEKNSRILATMFYHIGRWIYIIDACDDYEADFREDAYNPITYRYQLSRLEQQNKSLPEHIKAEVKNTLTHSLAGAASAFELLDFHCFEGLFANVIYQGLYAVTVDVLNGTWQQRSKSDERPL